MGFSTKAVGKGLDPSGNVRDGCVGEYMGYQNVRRALRETPLRGYGNSIGHAAIVVMQNYAYYGNTDLLDEVFEVGVVF